MTADDDVEARGRRVEIDVVETVQDIDGRAVQLHYLDRGQLGANAGVVDVAADGSQRRNFRKRTENVGISDISGVKDVVDAIQRRHHLRPQEAMCVRDDADSHGVQSPIDKRVRGSR